MESPQRYQGKAGMESPQRYQGKVGMESPQRYQGKVVIVTGGTSGIGLATVREFVRQGAHVVFCSRACDAERGEAIVRELEASGCPGDACYLVCDVCKESDIQKLIRVTLDRYGCLDCLVNNAGNCYFESLDDVTARDFNYLVELHIVSPLLLSKYALPYIRQTKGNIINMGCLDGVIGMKDVVSSATTKGAVIAMTKAMAIDESKYGVRVNCISPSIICTPLWEREANRFVDPEAVIEEVKKFQLMGRMGTPEEVALGVLFLAADATFCTGLNLVLSGGAEIGFGIKSQMGPDTSALSLRNLRDPFHQVKET